MASIRYYQQGYKDGLEGEPFREVYRNKSEDYILGYRNGDMTRQALKISEINEKGEVGAITEEFSVRI